MKTAAYEILRSFYNQNKGPVYKMWRDIKDGLEYLGKNTAVRELGLDTLSQEETTRTSNGNIPNGQF